MPRSRPHAAVLAALLAVTASTAPPTQALQGYANGHLLNAWCEREEKIDVEACLSYLRGVFDTVTAIQETRGASDAPARGDVDEICIPGNVPVTQLRIVFVRYARFNPHALSVQASVAVMRALKSAFPCVEK